MLCFSWPEATGQQEAVLTSDNFDFDLQSLSNLNDVILLLGPLRRFSNTSSLVMAKIATLLMMPFIKEV